MRFRTTLELGGKTATGMRVPPEVVELDVEVALDTEPRVVEVPDDLAAALGATPSAEKAFKALSYSNQRRHVLAVEGAKAPATRERRIAKVVSALTCS